MSNVIIVESPNKIKKIKSFVGPSYTISSSVGHIRNLDPKNLSVDVNNNFKPTYIIIQNKQNVVRDLRALVHKDTTVWLATDYDREGEAIAYHLKEVLGVTKQNYKRIVFTSITKKAILDAIAKPSEIDMNMFYSQQARMILDKLIGYKLSPLLWKYYNNFKLSAGRVQSVVVKIVDEREKEINKFDSSSYFKLIGGFNLEEKDCKSRLEKLKKPILLPILEINSDINSEADMKFDSIELVYGLNNLVKDKLVDFKINSLKKNKTIRRPQPPYTTSSLLQDASNKLGMGPEACMKNAQKLYEAGCITYMRTDSTILADEALKEIEKYVLKEYGDKYYKKTQYATVDKNAQEAHEACRPTKIDQTDVFGKEGLTSGQNRLYKMIWQRTVASQMSPAEIEIKTVKISPELNLDNKDCKNKCKEIAIDIKKALKAKDKKDDESTPISKKKKSKSKDKAEDTEDKEDKEDKKKDDDKITSKSVKKSLEKINFVGKHEKILFDGFLKLSGLSADLDEDDDEDDDENLAKNLIKSKKSKTLEKLFEKLKENDKVHCFYLNSEEKFTKPPHGRYTEASLVKKLKELGIGRPSTYASSISKVQERTYVERKTQEPVKKDIRTLSLVYNDIELTEKTKTINIGGDKNKLFPTPLGIMITKFLNEKFVDLMNYKFTADVEEMLDDIAKGKKIWYKVVQAVYDKFNPTVNELSLSIGKDEKQEITLGMNPDNDYDIKVINAKYGPVIAEVGLDPEGKKVIKYAPLPCSPESMDLDLALLCLRFPLEIGEYEDETIYLCRAKSYYLKYNGKTISIDIHNTNNKDNEEDIIKVNDYVGVDMLRRKVDDLNDLTGTDFIKLTDAIKAINYQRNHMSDKVINKDITIKIGKFGPYIKYKGKINVPISYKYKNNLDNITEEDCMDCINKKLKKLNMKADEIKEEKAKKAKAKKEEKMKKPRNNGMVRRDVRAEKVKKASENTKAKTKAKKEKEAQDKAKKEKKNKELDLDS